MFTKHWKSLPRLHLDRLNWSNCGFFGGLTLQETAEILGISERMGDKDWALAKAWLRRRPASL
jgi:ECF sigma factor